jgi:RNA polymerase sigma-70 factor, ECF subfamily
LEDFEELPVVDDEELVILDDALDELTRLDERQGKIVQMKFFGGLSAPEIPQLLGISLATAEATARIWLRREMSRAASP